MPLSVSEILINKQTNQHTHITHRLHSMTSREIIAIISNVQPIIFVIGCRRLDHFPAIQLSSATPAKSFITHICLRYQAVQFATRTNWEVNRHTVQHTSQWRQNGWWDWTLAWCGRKRGQSMSICETRRSLWRRRWTTRWTGLRWSRRSAASTLPAAAHDRKSHARTIVQPPPTHRRHSHTDEKRNFCQAQLQHFKGVQNRETYTVRFTYIAPQVAYAASSTRCVRDRACVQPRPQPKLDLTDFGMQPYVAHVCCFNGLHPVIHVILLSTDPKRMDGWVDLLADPYRTLYTQSGHCQP